MIRTLKLLLRSARKSVTQEIEQRALFDRYASVSKERSSMKITLCYPALVPGVKPKYGMQPLGVLYIGALLKREGFDVSVIDGEIEGLSVQQTVARILNSNPDLVGFSLMTPQLMTALACSASLKQV